MGTSEDSGQLKTSKSSSELSPSTTFSSSSSFSLLSAGYEGVALSSALYGKIGSTFSTPCDTGPGFRKLGAATLIWCR